MSSFLNDCGKVVEECDRVVLFSSSYKYCEYAGQCGRSFLSSSSSHEDGEWGSYRGPVFLTSSSNDDGKGRDQCHRFFCRHCQIASRTKEV